MFSLQKLLGKDDKFFRLMEGSAEEAFASIRSLTEMLDTPEEKRSLNAFINARRKDKRITQELSEHLSRTFVTPLDCSPQLTPPSVVRNTPRSCCGPYA